MAKVTRMAGISFELLNPLFCGFNTTSLSNLNLSCFWEKDAAETSSFPPSCAVQGMGYQFVVSETLKAIWTPDAETVNFHSMFAGNIEDN